MGRATNRNSCRKGNRLIVESDSRCNILYDVPSTVVGSSQLRRGAFESARCCIQHRALTA